MAKRTIGKQSVGKKKTDVLPLMLPGITSVVFSDKQRVLGRREPAEIAKTKGKRIAVKRKYTRREQPVLPVDSPVEIQIKNLGARIKKLRLGLGYTNADFFAYDYSISRSQYGRYERGEDIRFSSLLRILQIHKLSLKEFFSEGFE